jgi:hypothetical protein
VPSCGLKRAVEKIIKGEYEIERGFIPRPPELAAMARAEAKTIREDLVRLREKETTIKSMSEAQQARPDEAAKERIRNMLGRFRMETAARKAQVRGVPINEPISPEKAEYWQKIQALKDAPEITAEQQAFRRKIEMDMSSADTRKAAE